jgi:hypothetical protein
MLVAKYKCLLLALKFKPRFEECIIAQDACFRPVNRHALISKRLFFNELSIKLLNSDNCNHGVSLQGMNSTACGAHRYGKVHRGKDNCWGRPANLQ